MKDAVPGTHFHFILTIEHNFFMILGVNAGTVRVGGGLSLPIAFSRAYTTVSVYVVGIGVGVSAAGAGGWFFRRVVMWPICFFAWS